MAEETYMGYRYVLRFQCQHEESKALVVQTPRGRVDLTLRICPLFNTADQPHSEPDIPQSIGIQTMSDTGFSFGNSQTKTAKPLAGFSFGVNQTVQASKPQFCGSSKTGTATTAAGGQSMFGTAATGSQSIFGAPAGVAAPAASKHLGRSMTPPSSQPQPSESSPKQPVKLYNRYSFEVIRRATESSAGLQIDLQYRVDLQGLWNRTAGRILEKDSNIIYLCDFLLHSSSFKNVEMKCDVFWSEEDDKGWPLGEMALDYGGLLKSSKLSDFTIKVGNQKFTCHKAILAARSSFFERMLINNTEEEGTVQELSLTDISPDTVSNMLNYIYTNTVENIEEAATDLLPVADKYSLTGLKAMCSAALIPQIKVETAVDLALMSDKHNVENLRRAAIRYIVDNKKWYQKDPACHEVFLNNPALVLDMFKML